MFTKKALEEMEKQLNEEEISIYVDESNSCFEGIKKSDTEELIIKYDIKITETDIEDDVCPCCGRCI